MATQVQQPPLSPATPPAGASDRSRTEPHDAPQIEPLVDALPFLDHRARRRAVPAPDAGPGRYLAAKDGDTSLLIPLDRDLIHVGRSFSAELRLEEPRVSRRHALIVRRGDTLRLLDDRSANGTFVNGHRIVESDLSDGDEILFGALQFRYVEVRAPTGTRA
jgi:hypothetical protein